MSKKTLVEKVDALARKKGGKCLSMDKYAKESSGLMWECKNGHQWLARYTDAKKNWCPLCPKPKRRFIFFKKNERHIDLENEPFKKLEKSDY